MSEEKFDRRSQYWFGLKDKGGYIHRERLRNQGYAPDVFDGRPVIGIWSHFARADEPGSAMNQTQLSRFNSAVEQLKNAGISSEYLHVANSAASLTNQDAHKNIIRWGIGLYGLSPDVNNMGSSAELGLKPAMKLISKLQLVKAVKAGQSVGYGSTATTKVDTKLGVVTMGYADGIPRNANNLAGVFVAGQRAALIGRVSMDQFVVDLGAASLAKTGDEVIVFGDGSGGCRSCRCRLRRSRTCRCRRSSRWRYSCCTCRCRRSSRWRCSCCTCRCRRSSVAAISWD